MLSGYVFLMTYLAICFMLAPYILYKCSKTDRIDWGIDPVYSEPQLLVSPFKMHEDSDGAEGSENDEG